jgi:hypothetical protein
MASVNLIAYYISLSYFVVFRPIRLILLVIILLAPTVAPGKIAIEIAVDIAAAWFVSDDARFAEGAYGRERDDGQHEEGGAHRRSPDDDHGSTLQRRLVFPQSPPQVFRRGGGDGSGFDLRQHAGK